MHGIFHYKCLGVHTSDLLKVVWSVWLPDLKYIAAIKETANMTVAVTDIVDHEQM